MSQARLTINITASEVTINIYILSKEFVCAQVLFTWETGIASEDNFKTKIVINIFAN